MGFEFGVITNLDYTVTLYCFFIVVAFVLAMEYITGVMEYFLETSKLYTDMVQMIYKELMLMGLLTFAVTMFEAEHENGVSSSEEKWLEAIDFSHVFLFFVTFFFVSHAFYLMFSSAKASQKYRVMFFEETADIVDQVEEVKYSCWGRFVFNLKFLPLSAVRDKVEFNLIHSLFTSRYLVPEDFDFPLYLSGCFDRYALRTINRSKITWLALLVLIFVNFIRIQLGFSCVIESDDDDDERRRMLQFIATTASTSSSTSTISTSTSSTGTNSEGGLLTSAVTESLSRDLPFPDYDYSSSSRRLDEGDGCRVEMYYMFLLVGALLICYTFILTIITRLYKIRLIHQVGSPSAGPEDYINFLRLKEKNLVDQRESVLKAGRISAAQLKKEIETEFDVNEEGEEDEEGFKFLGELLKTIVRTVTEKLIILRIAVQNAFYSCCWGASYDDKNAAGMGSTGSSKNSRKKKRNILFTDSIDEGPVSSHSGWDASFQSDNKLSGSSSSSIGLTPTGTSEATAAGSIAAAGSNPSFDDASAAVKLRRGAAAEEREYIPLKVRMNAAKYAAAAKIAMSWQHAAQLRTASATATSDNGSTAAVAESAAGTAAENPMLPNTATGGTTAAVAVSGTAMPPPPASSTNHENTSTPFSPAGPTQYPHSTGGGPLRLSTDSPGVLGAPTQTETPAVLGGANTQQQQKQQHEQAAAPLEENLQNVLDGYRMAKQVNEQRRRETRSGCFHCCYPQVRPVNGTSTTMSADATSGSRKAESRQQLEQLAVLAAHAAGTTTSPTGTDQQQQQQGNGTTGAAPFMPTSLNSQLRLQYDRHEQLHPDYNYHHHHGVRWIETDDEGEAEGKTFHSIYFLGRPKLYFRAVELQIMFSCVYLALWSTSFISIVSDISRFSSGSEAAAQIIMLVPVLLSFWSISYIAETSSMILAISDLNLGVMHQVLVDHEDMDQLTQELRDKIMEKIRKWWALTNPGEEQQLKFVKQLFSEIDQDHSGLVDKSEFRLLLRQLNLTYSNYRFNLLFRAVDSVGGDGRISEAELTEFLFPGCLSGTSKNNAPTTNAADASNNADAGGAVDGNTGILGDAGDRSSTGNFSDHVFGGRASQHGVPLGIMR